MVAWILDIVLVVVSLAFMILAMVYVATKCFKGARVEDRDVTHPKVTPLEARRQLLQKAQDEYRFRAQWGREQ